MEEFILPDVSSDRSDINEVKVYRSSESEIEEKTQCNKIQKKKQKCVKKWIFNKHFLNEKETEEFLKLEKVWSRNYTRDCEEGRKRFYRCNKVKKRGPQCQAELYLLFVNNADDVIAYKTESKHNHDEIGARVSYGITDKTKQEINKLLTLGLKPKKILEALNKMEGIQLPTKRQLSNYLYFLYNNKRIPVTFV